MTAIMSTPWLVLSMLVTIIIVGCDAQLVESERRQEYHNRNYTWPLPEVVPNTPGWRRLMDRRFAQILAMEDSHSRYEGFVQTMSSALTVPNYTENGWGLTKVPDDLLQALQKGIRDGLKDAVYEREVEVIEGDDTCLFINRPDLTTRVLKELHPFFEAWSGVELTPFTAYGFRLYQNNSRLFMHTDKTMTHIISGILHIDRSEDAEPWPIVIEDYQGNTNEVLLEPGDLLFYESSKCWHGRPKRFKGSWYTSIFVHNYPKDWDGEGAMMDLHYAVPPAWSDDPTPTDEAAAVMVGTSMKETDCEHVWCGLKDSIKWSGGGEKDYVLTTGNHRYPLFREEQEL